MVLFVVLVALCGFLFTRMPGSFLPEEDQGFALAIVQLPPGATKNRTNEVFAQMRGVLQQQDAVEGMLQVAGFSFLGSGENVGMGFIRLKPWGDRKATATELIQQLNGAFYGIKGAQIFVVNLPTVNGLGQFGGFDMWLQDRSGAGQEALTNARNILLGQAAQRQDTLVGVRPNGLENSPQLQLHVDRIQAESMGLSVTDIYSAVQLMLAPVYVNDFFYEGRIKRVNVPRRRRLPDRSRIAAQLLHAQQHRDRCRWPAGDDPAEQCHQVRVDLRLARLEPLQRLLGGEHRRQLGPGQVLRPGDDGDGRDRAR